MTKPFEPKELVQAVAELVASAEAFNTDTTDVECADKGGCLDRTRV